ncbi:reverse transcriptase domain-containing protein [Tanacetum coccineum]
MAKEDEEKMAFITSQGIFYYSKMPFGLKNVGATYLRLVDKSFQKQICRNLEVYVDDMVIKSRTKQEIIRDIEETFKTLREINMKLNPKKCTFGIEEGMFLGYKVNTKGIKVYPNKVETVLGLPSPKCLKDLQRLNGKLSSLNRFLAKLAEKSLPFFKTLKKCTKNSDFQWSAEAEAAFRQMKKTNSRTAHTNCTYGKGGTYCLPCDNKRSPNQASAVKPRNCRRTAEIEYRAGEYDIHYRPRISIKGKILADFIVESPKDDTLVTPIEVEKDLLDPWTLFTDRSSYANGFGAKLILTNPEGTEFTYALRFRFNATNNEAEYEALIAGLRIAEQMRVKNLQTHVDSHLVANQVNGSYIAKEPGMVPRGENKKVDALSKIASTSFANLTKQIKSLVFEGKENGVNILKSIDEGPFQMGTFWETIAEGDEGALHLGPERPRVYYDLSPEDKDRYNADIWAINILLQGLPKDIYSLINHYTDAKDIWDNVKMPLEGSELTKEDRESQLYDDFEHFRQHKGETIHDHVQNVVEF